MILLFEKIREKLTNDLKGMSPEGSQTLVSYYLGYLEALSEGDQWGIDVLIEMRHWLLYTLENHRVSQRQYSPLPDRKSDQYGYTPLHLAVLMHSERLMDALLAENRLVDPVDHQGNTPLHLAVLANELRTAQKLLAAGADPNLLNIENRRPDQRTLDPTMLGILNRARERQVLDSVPTPNLNPSRFRRF